MSWYRRINKSNSPSSQPTNPLASAPPPNQPPKARRWDMYTAYNTRHHPLTDCHPQTDSPLASLAAGPRGKAPTLRDRRHPRPAVAAHGSSPPRMCVAAPRPRAPASPCTGGAGPCQTGHAPASPYNVGCRRRSTRHPDAEHRDTRACTRWGGWWGAVGLSGGSMCGWFSMRLVLV